MILLECLPWIREEGFVAPEPTYLIPRLEEFNVLSIFDIAITREVNKLIGTIEMSSNYNLVQE